MVGNDSVYKSFHFSSRDPVDEELDGGKPRKTAAKTWQLCLQTSECPFVLKVFETAVMV